MKSQTRVKDYDQFQLRLPPGMRERIKSKADRAGMSMNDAILWCLERHFPAPATLEAKISHLSTLVALLKRGNDFEQQIDTLIDDLDSTLRDVANGKIKTSTDFRANVFSQIDEWDGDAAEDATDPFDDENWSSYRSDETPEYVPVADDDPFADPPKKQK